MQQLERMNRALIYALKGVSPLVARLTPTLAGRQGPEVSGSRQQDNVGSGQVKDYSTQASAFLLDLPRTDVEKKEPDKERVSNELRG